MLLHAVQYKSTQCKKQMVGLLLASTGSARSDGIYLYATRLVCEESERNRLVCGLGIGHNNKRCEPSSIMPLRPATSRENPQPNLSKKQQWHRLEAHSFQVLIIMYVYLHSHRFTSELFEGQVYTSRNCLIITEISCFISYIYCLFLHNQPNSSPKPWAPWVW